MEPESLQCPACETVFRRPPKLPDHGMVRCGRCQHLFSSGWRSLVDEEAGASSDAPNWELNRAEPQVDFHPDAGSESSPGEEPPATSFCSEPIFAVEQNAQDHQRPDEITWLQVETSEAKNAEVESVLPESENELNDREDRLEEPGFWHSPFQPVEDLGLEHFGDGADSEFTGHQPGRDETDHQNPLIQIETLIAEDSGPNPAREVADEIEAYSSSGSASQGALKQVETIFALTAPPVDSTETDRRAEQPVYRAPETPDLFEDITVATLPGNEPQDDLIEPTLLLVFKEGGAVSFDLDEVRRPENDANLGLSADQTRNSATTKPKAQSDISEPMARAVGAEPGHIDSLTDSDERTPAWVTGGLIKTTWPTNVKKFKDSADEGLVGEGFGSVPIDTGQPWNVQERPDKDSAPSTGIAATLDAALEEEVSANRGRLFLFLGLLGGAGSALIADYFFHRQWASVPVLGDISSWLNATQALGLSGGLWLALILAIALCAALPFFQTKNRPDSEIETDIADQLVAQAMRGRRIRILEALLAAVLTCLAIWQLIYWNQGQLLKNPIIHRVLYNACGQLGCEIEVLSDISQIKLLGTRVISPPDKSGVLEVDGTLMNEAPFSQPYPYVRLGFKRQNSSLITSRVFKPAEYLNGVLVDKELMVAGVPVSLHLELVDPGFDATNYQFELLPGPAIKGKESRGAGAFLSR